MCQTGMWAQFEKSNNQFGIDSGLAHAKYYMTKKFVRVVTDIHCAWEGLAPTYRVYVNNELFTERTWIWTQDYLEEMLQIEAEPGRYLIRYELVSPNLAQLEARNMRVVQGTANIKSGNLLRILDES